MKKEAQKQQNITTPFDMRVLNHLDRFDLAKDAVEQIPALKDKSAAFIDKMDSLLSKHHAYIRDHGEDIPEVTSWKWTGLDK